MNGVSLLDMDKEFLEDYDAKERKSIENLVQDIRNGHFHSESRYPDASRLPIEDPCTLLVHNESLWNQLLPHVGTVVVELFPFRNEKHFERSHGFNVEDIGRLIDYSKDGTSRPNLRFALSDYPKLYHGVVFMEPLFRELNPPVLANVSPWSIRPKDPQLEFWFKEATILSATLKKNPLYLTMVEYLYGERKPYEVSDFRFLIANDYSSLRYLGYNKLADEIAINLSLDPGKALLLLKNAKDFLLSPYQSLLRGVKSAAREEFSSSISELSKYASKKVAQKLTSGVRFPCEIGQFLNDKIKLIVPKNFEGVIEVNDKYQPEDVLTLMRSLDHAVNESDPDLVKQSSKDLFTSFENMWSEAKHLRKNINVVTHGVALGIAVIGAIATMPIGGIGGLLAGLGFEIVEKIVEDVCAEGMSEKIVSFTKPSHLMQIYSFQRRHKL